MSKIGIGLAALIAAAGVWTGSADTLTWTGMTGDWHAVDNWTNAASPENTRVPADGDDAAIINVGALAILSNSSAFLGSLVISNATLSCSNWGTLLSATNVIIRKSGALTCIGPFTNNGVSNRVNLLCTNLLIEAGGSIDVKGKGFSGGLSTNKGQYAAGHGPGGGRPVAPNYMCGAAHGGAGNFGNTGVLFTNTYGSATAPLDPGSGGQAGYESNQVSSHGGGAVRIVADQVTVSGTINADASVIPAYFGHASGGSGGGIYITCRTIAGTNGVISANGANAYWTPDIYGGGGGGGRIAVVYDSAAQGALPVPSLKFSAAPGMSSYGRLRYYGLAEIGTLYFPDTTFFSPTNLFDGQWVGPLPASLDLSDWVVSNVWCRLGGLTLTVTNALEVVGTNYSRNKLEFTNEASIECGQLRISGATFGLARGETEGAVLVCQGGLTMTNAGALDVTRSNQARFHVEAGLACDGGGADEGARVQVGGDLVVSTNCWIFPSAHPTNGAVPMFSMHNITVHPGGGINADAAGYMGGLTNSIAYGPGAGIYSHGASYGGRGTVGYYSTNVSPADPYGASNAPVAPGSGAPNGSVTTIRGPSGGGSIQLRAADTATVRGVLSADGGIGATYYGGGASGGAIYLTCKTYIGDSQTVLRANGGNGDYVLKYENNYGGAGGGGRIAVWRINDLSPEPSSASVAGGAWYRPSLGTNYAESGTIVWGWLPSAGTVIRFR